MIYLISPLSYAYIVPAESQSHYLQFCYSWGPLSTVKRVSPYPIAVHSRATSLKTYGTPRLSAATTFLFSSMQLFFSERFSERWIKPQFKHCRTIYQLRCWGTLASTSYRQVKFMFFFLIRHQFERYNQGEVEPQGAHEKPKAEDRIVVQITPFLRTKWIVAIGSMSMAMSV